MLCACGVEFSGAVVEAPGVASVFCPSGHRKYLFKRDDGVWETQEERRSRLASLRVCERCGEDYMLSFSTWRKNDWRRMYCCGCQSAIASGSRQQNKGMERGPYKRNNETSPWRQKRKPAPDGYWKGERDNPR